ncbi:unnamed protein product [Paramecium octaurelia]|uniref:RING-type domain-containing protein n=1 Tax=Paramecium octaurelia TaxID=43137 RepID=A0A8S1WCJ0_PAROT|nr:unnamed protein product [Paramecium octaurelia]
MKSDRPIYKACRLCQKEFLQNEIFNHQRSCTSKSKEIHKSNSSQPQINLQQIQPQPQPYQKSQSLQNNQIYQSSNVDIKLSQQIYEKSNGKVIILDVQPMPAEDNKMYIEQSKQNIYQQPIQQQPIQQYRIQQQPIQQQHIQQSLPPPEKFQKSESNQIDQSDLVKCEHCDGHINSKDKDYHELNCSSVIRFKEIIKEVDYPQVWQKQELPSDPKQFETTNQKIIAQYLKIYPDSKDIIQKGKKLLEEALFKSLKFKKSFDQKTCYFCRNYFKEDEIIYNLQCCLLKCHKNCLHNMLKKSTKCYCCQKELFPKAKVKM